MAPHRRKRITSGASPGHIARDLESLLNFGTRGIPLDELNQLIETCLLPHFVDYGHPGFHSLYNFFLEEGAALGAEIALRHNQGVTNWQVSPGGVMLEEGCCRALCRLFGLSRDADATFMYSGTYANQQALYLALHRHAERSGFDLAADGLAGFRHPKRLALVASREAHFSLRQTLRMMGLGEKSLVAIEVDTRRRMDMAAFKATVDGLKQTRDIFCVVATAGTSSTGSIDPIPEIMEWGRDRQTWIHVDAAYGLIYSLLSEKKALFEGLEAADSVTWDPHKQLGVPIPSSLLFLKNGQDFERMAVYSGYYNRKGEAQPNPGLKSPPSTRPLAALPLVATFRHLGIDGVKARLQRHIDTVREAAAYISTQPDLELMLPPDLGIFCMRVAPPGYPPEGLDQLQQTLYKRTLAEGKRSVSLTDIAGRKALRFLILSSTAKTPHLIETFDYLRALARNVAPSETSGG